MDVLKPNVCKPDVLKLDVLKPDVFKPDVLKPDVLWVFQFSDLEADQLFDFISQVSLQIIPTTATEFRGQSAG
jgi:hypothetical protein